MRTTKLFGLTCSGVLLLFMSPPWVAAQPVAHTYGLLVGSNPGGEGQSELHYAHEDAARLAQVLTELGHFAAPQTRVLRSPSRAALLAALDDLAKELQEHAERGEQAQLVFYYSGHARANALQLGAEELPLSELRERVLQLPSTFKLIVLDACQSGAFSSVKGAAPAAAFSYNSVARLRTSGVAVMASSSASELSQESDSLQGSFFTHHLTVALRGAGDRDRDGVVSLSEAYAYAYDHTLSSTARTSVGRQHVTLETALTGQGEVPLTYPARAEAQLTLPPELDADVLVERHGRVLAELHKVRGSAVSLAFSSGVYKAVLRRGATLTECDLPLSEGRSTWLEPRACTPITEAQARAKGRDFAGLPPQAAQARAPQETWSMVLAIGARTGTVHDAYVHRLQDFGFESGFELMADPSWQVTFGRQLSGNWSLGLDARNLDTGNSQRPLYGAGAKTTHFSWTSYALTAQLQAHVDTSRWVRLFAQLGAGAGLVHSELNGDAEDQFGPVLAGSLGLYIMPWKVFGFVLQGMYTYAPILSNELNETHNSGGLSVTTGLRFRIWSEG